MKILESLIEPMADVVYLDNAASTRPLPELLEVMQDLCGFAFVNASAATMSSVNLKRAIKKMESHFRELAHLSDADFIWTGGGTEANNLALFGAMANDGNLIGREIVTSVVEHPSIDRPLGILEGRGAIVRQVPVDATGMLDLQALSSVLSSATCLVSVSMVQSEVGAIQNMSAIRELMDIRCPRALLHSDAVQALVKVPLSWESARIDLTTFSGHKFHALGGTGLLAVRNGVKLTPMIHGGGQQGNLRSGSLDGIGILAFLYAATTLLERVDVVRNVASELNARLRRGILEVAPNAVFNSTTHGSPFILNVSFPNYEGAVLMRLLDSLNVTVATGSACSSGKGEPSRALSAMKMDRRMAYAAIRISLGCTTTAEEIDVFVERLKIALATY